MERSHTCAASGAYLGFADEIQPLATKSKLISLVNVRHFWETGAQLKTQGQSLVVTATFPVPSVKIPPTK
jgi:hypothetical protein